jgi:EAL domain-containing protein (putative c-di-GMP-specific phosphodiesterase class I)
MAHRWGIKVVAEGIETEQQLRLMIGIGCDCGQGFYFCRPLPVDDVEAFVNQHDRASITCLSD